MIKGLYHYLDKIKFEEQVIQKAKQYQKVSDNPMFSDMVILNSYFSLMNQLYEEIYKDIDKNKK